MRILIVLLFNSIFLSAYSQDSLKRSFVFFKNKHVIAYLDGKKINPSLEPLFLKPGVHKIQAWAPTYRLLEDSFMVTKNNTLYKKRLKRSGEYRKFVLVKTLRTGSVFVPFIATGLYALVFHTNMGQRKLELNSASERKFNYEMKYNRYHKEAVYNGYPPVNNNPYTKLYDDAVESLREAEKNYKRTKVTGIVVVSALATVSVAYMIHICRHRKTYKETPLLTRICPLVDPFNKQAGICLQL